MRTDPGGGGGVAGRVNEEKEGKIHEGFMINLE
jgi:hypothetical protein